MSPQNTGAPSEPSDPSERDLSAQESVPAPAPETGTEAVPQSEPQAQNVVRAADVVDPAAVRRAPRFRSFVLAGVLSGLILGLIIGLIVFREPQNRTFLVLMLMVDLALITTLIALIWAVVSERRSTGKRRGGRKTTA